MKKINVTKEQLCRLKRQMLSSDGILGTGSYEMAWKLGWPGFAGGLDHIRHTLWSLTIVDRGVSGSGYVRDNTTEFVVPVEERE
ncbi:MAG: hypothetical protein DDT19_00885 [Syntrophomonadaceae bacterium]|nr:hypothetical protein [Bacillota bacterium]